MFSLKLVALLSLSLTSLLYSCHLFSSIAPRSPFPTTGYVSVCLCLMAPLRYSFRRLPIWFSMLHPLADLSPVISRTGDELSYVSDSVHHMVYASSQSSPYLTVVYDTVAKTHSMHLVRRTTPQVCRIQLWLIQ